MPTGDRRDAGTEPGSAQAMTMRTPHAHAHAGHADHEHDAAPGTDSLKDPVCGMTVTSQSPHHAQHDGKPYWFCGARCLAKFTAEPAKYLQDDTTAPATDAVEAPAGTIYTCPMHPEIRQDHPGSCPKCGMALEPEMPSARRRREPRARRLQAPLLVDAAADRDRGRAGDVRPPPGLVRHGHAELDRTGAVAARRALGRLRRSSCAARNRSSTAAPTCGR